ncbi:MAG: type II secretion system F family protein [Planctomycetota bacterium]
MTLYHYRAIGRDGRRTRGEMQLGSERELEERLASEGLLLVEARAEKRASVKTKTSRAKVKSKALQEFTLNLSTMISAGVPLVASLDLLSAELEDARLKKIIEKISSDLHEGASFSEALERFPRVFAPIYVSLVAAGEISGNLEGTLQEIAAYMEWQSEIKGHIKQATIYPTIILTAVLGLVILLITFVIPTFMEIFIKAQMPLPLPTRILISVSNFFTSYWHLLIGSLIAILLALRMVKRFEKGTYWLDSAKLKIPIFGKVIGKIALARFAQNMAVLFHAGVPVTAGLSMCQRLVGNAVYSKSLEEAERLVTRGQGIAESLRSTGNLPPMVINMISVGEETGKLGHTLQKVKCYYDREVKASIQKAFAVLEPAIIAGMGGLVGFMAITVLYTMFKMVSYIGKT